MFAAMLLSSLGGAVVLAQEENGEGERPGIEERRQQLEERREERRERLSELRQERVQNFWDRMSSRLTRIIDRLSAIGDRILSRIEKFEERGADMSEARTALDGAREQIGLAEGAMADAGVALEDLLDSDNPKEAFADVRVQVRVVIDAIKAAHAGLVDAITAMKGVSTAVRQDEAAQEEGGGEEGGGEEGEEE